MTEVSRNLRNIFFSQNTPDFESLSWIFIHLKKILIFLTKYIEQPSYKVIMTEVSRNLRNVFFNQNTPDFES